MFQEEAARAFRFLLTEYGFRETARPRKGIEYSNDVWRLQVLQEVGRDFRIYIFAWRRDKFHVFEDLVERCGSYAVEYEFPGVNEFEISSHALHLRNLSRLGTSRLVIFEGRRRGPQGTISPGATRLCELPALVWSREQARRVLPLWADALRRFCEPVLSGAPSNLDKKSNREALLEQWMHSDNPSPLSLTRLLELADAAFLDEDWDYVVGMYEQLMKDQGVVLTSEQQSRLEQARSALEGRQSD